MTTFSLIVEANDESALVRAMKHAQRWGVEHWRVVGQDFRSTQESGPLVDVSSEREQGHIAGWKQAHDEMCVNAGVFCLHHRTPEVAPGKHRREEPALSPVDLVMADLPMADLPVPKHRRSDG